ncbi:hypothetical protein APHAL10511_006908 [Amanita phalloides]|nr:hypothetical protein APHAL10511_006908 [Amanita phalloides]
MLGWAKLTRAGDSDHLANSTAHQSVSTRDFIFSLRPVCESLFYFLLLAYKTGIKAYQLWSTTRAINATRPQPNAAIKASARDSVADEITESTLEKLQQSIAAIPSSHSRGIDLMDNWDEEGVQFC